MQYFIRSPPCHNGKWYTLRSIPRFGRDGLWFYDTIGFSRSGSLTNTLINLATRSPAGMTAQQLGEKLRCRCHSVLIRLYRHGKLQRRKLGGSHIYLAVDPATQAMQCQAMAGKSSPPVQLPAEVAVFILAEFIRHPDCSFEQLANYASPSFPARCHAHRRAFCSTRFKKNDADCGAKALRALSRLQEQTAREISPASLFPRPPVIRFAPKPAVCSCGGQLMVRKTRRMAITNRSPILIAYCRDFGPS